MWPFQVAAEIDRFFPLGLLEYFERVRTCRLQLNALHRPPPPGRDAKPPADPREKIGSFMGPKTHFPRWSID